MNRSRYGRTFAALVAVAVLGVIALDLGDVACDPLRIGVGDALLSAVPSTGDDACADQCLPDCFCCATTVPAVALAAFDAIELQADRPAAPAGLPVAGYVLPVEHVPLARL